MENITAKQFIDIGYNDKEPSINYMVYCYYLKFFDGKTASKKADEYCKQFEIALESN